MLSVRERERERERMEKGKGKSRALVGKTKIDVEPITSAGPFHKTPLGSVTRDVMCDADRRWPKVSTILLFNQCPLCHKTKF